MIDKLSNQNSKNKLLLWILLPVMIFSFTACGNKIKKVAIETTKLYGLNESNELSLSSTFSPGTPEIVVKFDLVSPDYPLNIVGRLFYLDADDEKEEDYLVVEGDLTADYAGAHEMTVTRPDNGWPQGNYKVELYVEDKYEEPLSVANFIVL